MQNRPPNCGCGENEGLDGCCTVVGTSAISVVLLTVIRTLTALILLRFILGKWFILSVSFPLCASLYFSQPLTLQLYSLQGGILEWVALPLSRGSSQLRPLTLQAYSLLSELLGKPEKSRFRDFCLFRVLQHVRS